MAHHGGCRVRMGVLLCLGGFAALGCKESKLSGDPPGDPPIFEGTITELDEAVRNAELVFEGEVIGIEYASSMNNGQGELDPDADGTEDRGELPHTFVTYRISESFKGNYQEETVTLRFLGGVDPTPDPDDGYEITEVSQYPEFDVGDQDILFVKGNTELGCPLDRCANGRFRILTSPQDSEPMVFTELGQEVRLVERSETEAQLFFIGEHQIPEIHEHTVVYPDGSTATLGIASGEEEPGEEDPAGVAAGLQQKHSPEPPGGGPPLEDPGGPASAPVEGVRITPSQIRVLIMAAVARLYPNAPDFSDLPPALSADPSIPFSVADFADDPGPEDDRDPVVEPPERDPLEDLEAAAAERANIEEDNLLSPEDVATILGRREASTGIVEAPNEDDGTADEENMWTEVGR
jgi:hypothetical protein